MKDKALQVLLIEDNAGDARLLRMSAAVTHRGIAGWAGSRYGPAGACSVRARSLRRGGFFLQAGGVEPDALAQEVSAFPGRFPQQPADAVSQIRNRSEAG